MIENEQKRKRTDSLDDVDMQDEPTIVIDYSPLPIDHRKTGRFIASPTLIDVDENKLRLHIQKKLSTYVNTATNESFPLDLRDTDVAFIFKYFNASDPPKLRYLYVRKPHNTTFYISF